MPGRRDRVPLDRRRGSDLVANLGPGVPSRRSRAPVRRRSGSRACAPRAEHRAARARVPALAAAALLVLGACGSGGGTSAPPTGGTTPSPASLVEERSAAGQPETTLATRWARTLSGPSNEDEIDGIAAAPDGGVYLTGKFERSTTVGTTTLESAGAADIPVARVEADGTVAWVARYGGTGEDNFFDIAADDRGAVASGIFTGTVAFGCSTLTSAGGADCAVVAFARDGSVRWATSLGGPGADGCNEISIAPDGSVITSLDTDGGWTSPAGAIPEMRWSDTLLLRLDPAGAVVWGRRVGGDGPQRGKSLAVGPDGSIAFGGDSVGALVADGTSVGAAGGRRDGWITEWSADGRLRWSAAWGGPGDDLVKGLAYEGSGIFAVGTFGGAIDIGGTRLDAGAEDDLFVTTEA